MAGKSVHSFGVVAAKDRTRLELCDSPAPLRSNLHRKISPENGRALEILGHAIEYLADEHTHEMEQTGVLDATDPRLEAIQTLKRLNRDIYYACPATEPRFKRLAQWLLGF